MNDLLKDPTVAWFALCSIVLALKILLLGGATGLTRILRGNYMSPEDYATFGAQPSGESDPLIERLRRAHQNDLENILPFFLIGGIYVLTGPSPTTAWWLLTTFTVFRVLHTVVYALGLQPWRTIFFEGANIPNLIMAVMALLALL
jgi:uncharacterized MAPEG superfamily protein